MNAFLTREEYKAIASDTEYGLVASIFIANVTRAMRAGMVTVNSLGNGDDHAVS